MIRWLKIITIVPIAICFGILSDVFYFFTPIKDKFFSDLSAWAWAVEYDLETKAFGKPFTQWLDEWKND